MRTKYDKQLTALHDELIAMGALCETAIQYAVQALRTRDAELAKRTMQGDKEIDQKEHIIESACLKLLLEQQPVARDLREVSAALKMVTDLERIGDLAEDIADVSLFLCERPDYTAPEQIDFMVEAATKMVHDSIDAFVANDLAKAHSVMEYDDVVDRLFNEVRTVLVKRIHASMEDAEQAMDIMMVAKSLERIGDHAVNISEWVEFSITGIYKNSRVL